MGVVGVPGAEGEGEGREVADDAWVAAVEVFGQGIGEVVVAWWGWLCAGSLAMGYVWVGRYSEGWDRT